MLAKRGARLVAKCNLHLAPGQRVSVVGTFTARFPSALTFPPLPSLSQGAFPGLPWSFLAPSELLELL